MNFMQEWCAYLFCLHAGLFRVTFLLLPLGVAAEWALTQGRVCLQFGSQRCCFQSAPNG